MKFNATSRSDKGTSASRRLRHAGRVPAIVYGGTADPLSIELDHNEIYHALRKEEFHASTPTSSKSCTSISSASMRRKPLRRRCPCTTSMAIFRLPSS
jgi:ribosomal protein L25 (general stress protein Ctc)